MNLNKFCKKCLYSEDHPLGLVIDEEGICSGCRIHEEKDSLDWNFRWKSLQDIVKPFKSKSGTNYDCIVPVTGDKDSFYTVFLVKNKLKLNPLLVTYNHYFNTPVGIRNLARLRMLFDCDILYQNVNPMSVKKITRATLIRFGSVYWPFHAGQSVFPVQVAVQYKVPLIIWGAHQGLEQVGMFSHENEVEMTRRNRKDHDLMGFEADDLLTNFDVLNENDIWQYRYPNDSDLNEIGVRGIYLGNYVRWDPKAQHELMIDKFEYQSSKFYRTFDTYDHVGCFVYMGLHDLLKFYKHGYSKVTDHACREIRHKRISREKAVDLVKFYEQCPVPYIDLFCSWLGIEKKSLEFILNRHKNSKYWEKTDYDKWRFMGASSHFNSTAMQALDSDQALNFRFNNAYPLDDEAKFITFGKGYP